MKRKSLKSRILAGVMCGAMALTLGAGISLSRPTVAHAVSINGIADVTGINMSSSYPNGVHLSVNDRFCHAIGTGFVGGTWEVTNGQGYSQVVTPLGQDANNVVVTIPLVPLGTYYLVYKQNGYLVAYHDFQVY